MDSCADKNSYRNLYANRKSNLEYTKQSIPQNDGRFAKLNVRIYVHLDLIHN